MKELALGISYQFRLVSFLESWIVYFFASELYSSYNDKLITDKIKNYLQNRGQCKNKSISQKIHIFPCMIMLWNTLHWHLCWFTVDNIHLLPAWFLSPDCEMYTALHILKSLFFLSNIISVLSSYTLFMYRKSFWY